jgi:hypothetical protein
MNAKAKITVLLTFVLLCFSAAGGAQTGRRLWVLREAGEMTEHNPSTWAVKNTIKVPAEAVSNPEGLAVNRMGQILFFMVPQIESPYGGPGSGLPRIWLWNDSKGAFLDRTAAQGSPPYRGESSATVSQFRCTLSIDGRSLYSFENIFRIVKNADGAEALVTTTFRAWQTDLAAEKRIPIASFAFPVCKCETGACSETCPEASVWFPDGGVDDFFIITRWIPGQIESTYEDSSLFRKSRGNWSERKLPRVLENVQDAALGGTVVIHSILDGACCGWDNVSDDQTVLNVDGKETVIFDEFKRFGNPDYDVSFFTSNAKFSPDSRSIAMTVVSTALPGAEIRLSDQGKPNPEELARIRKSIADLPAVEVFRTADPSKPATLLPHATLVGWLDDNEMLVVENGFLVARDVRKNTRRISPIKAGKESLVFLR